VAEERQKRIQQGIQKQKQPANQNNWHLDHIYPVVKGGEHSYKNVAVSHPRCNQKKSDRLMSEIEKERLGW